MGNSVIEKSIFDQAVEYAKDIYDEYGNEINTTLAVGGVLLTSYISGKNGISFEKEIARIEAEKSEQNMEVSKKDICVTAGKHFWPALLSAGGTIGLIVANYIRGKKVEAGLLAMTGALHAAYLSKREDIPTKEELENEALGPIPQPGKELFHINTGYDEFWFEDDPSILNELEFAANWELHHTNVATINDIRKTLGLPETPTGEYNGWTEEGMCEFGWGAPIWIEFARDVKNKEDGTPYVDIRFEPEPDLTPMNNVYGFGIKEEDVKYLSKVYDLSEDDIRTIAFN